MTDQLITWIEAALGSVWFYPFLAVFVLVDALVPAFPSETALSLAGAWAGSQGNPNLGTCLAMAMIGGFIGDQLCFHFGKALYPQVKKVRIDSKAGKALNWVRDNMDRRAGATIIVARFIPWARWITTILLGSVRYNRGAFTFFDTIGVFLWAVLNLGTGYLGGRLFQDYPLIGLVAGMAFGILFGTLIQKAQNWYTHWREEKKGYAEA